MTLESVTKLGQTVVKGLTPQFLALIVVNILFLVILFWYLDARAQHSMTVINQLLTACLKDHQ